MHNARNNLSGRFSDFAVKIISLALRLRETAVGCHIGEQFTRAGTSAGSNYKEAGGDESRADFIHKLQLVLKELRRNPFQAPVDQKDRSCFARRSRAYRTFKRR